MQHVIHMVFACELSVCRKITPQKSCLSQFHCSLSVLINAESYSINMLCVWSQLLDVPEGIHLCQVSSC